MTCRVASDRLYFYQSTLLIRWFGVPRDLASPKSQHLQRFEVVVHHECIPDMGQLEFSCEGARILTASWCASFSPYVAPSSNTDARSRVSTSDGSNVDMWIIGYVVLKRVKKRSQYVCKQDNESSG